MDLIAKEKVYNAIREIEKTYDSQESERFKKDLALLKKTIENIPFDISINDTLFIKPKEESEEKEYKCLLCEAPVSLPYILCDKCCEEAEKEKEAYVKYAMEVSCNEK